MGLIKICEECKREFVPSVIDQNVCLACLIKPSRSEPKVKTCTSCQKPFEPKGNNQKKCDECRAEAQALEDLEPLPIKHDVTRETLNKLDSSFEEKAGELMRLAGVKKMYLEYEGFKVTIELVKQ
jgi:hypothetical protein